MFKAKTIFSFASVAILLAAGACAKNDVIADKRTPRVIDFTTYAGRSISKAGASFVTGGNFAMVQDPTIGVFADHRTRPGAWTGQFNFMNNVSVKLLGGGTVKSHEYTLARVWPTDPATNFISFWAYYPAGDSHFGNTVPAGLGTYEWTVDSDPSNQEDLMFADAVLDQTVTSNDGVVNFTFHHLLTQVKFAVEAPALSSAIDSIVIEGISIKNIATVDNVTASLSGGVVSWAWSGNATTPIDFDVVSRHITLTSAARQAGPVFLMMPQALVNAPDCGPGVQFAQIDYAVCYAGGVLRDESTATVPLYSEQVPAWEPNHNVRYTFTIGLNTISFKATADGWEDSQDAMLSTGND